MANPNPELHPENLKPIQPGESRNPNGSSNKQRITNALILLLEDGDLATLPSKLRKFVRSGFKQATDKGNIGYWKEIVVRVDGPVPEAEPPTPEINMEAIAERNLRKKAAKRKKAE